MADKTDKSVKTDEKAEVAKRGVKLVEFLTRARTDHEIVDKFGKDSLSDVASLAKKPPKGYAMLEGRNAFQEKTRYLEPVYTGKMPTVQGRVFQVLHSENDHDYLAIIFPPELDFGGKNKDQNAIKILAFDSLKWSDHLCDDKRFKGYLAWLEKKPYAFAIFNGGIIGGTGYNEETAATVRAEFKKLIAPVAHKILWAQSGQLEEQMMKRVDGVDPLRSVCLELEIHHANRPVRADVYWKYPTQPIEFYAIHGRSTANKSGAKLNAIINIVVKENFPHFTILGKLKDGKSKVMTARRLRPSRQEVVEHSANAIICPGFEKHEGSEAEKKGYDAPSSGTVTSIITADNRHKASS